MRDILECSRLWNMLFAQYILDIVTSILDLGTFT